MGVFLTFLGLWEAGWSTSTVKVFLQYMVSNYFVVAILFFFEIFWRPGWLMFGGFGSRRGSHNSITTDPKKCFLLIVALVLGQFWRLFWASGSAKKVDQNRIQT